MTMTAAPDTAALEEIPLYDGAFKADPYPFFAEWVRRAPFWASVQGRTCVVAARYDDVAEIYGDHDRFSSVKPPGAGMDAVDYFNGTTDMSFSDNPVHARLRSVVQPAFRVSTVAQQEPAVQSLVDELIATPAVASGRFDVMADLTRPLSARLLLGTLLRTPREDFPIFERLAYAMGSLAEVPPGGPKPQEYLDAWAAATSYCLGAVERLRDGDEGLLGLVVRARDAGTISDEELFGMLFTIYLGGLSTTATQLGNTVVELLRRPEQWDALVADPDLAEGATEEALRFAGAGLFNYRFASCDLTFRGLDVPKGTTVYIVMHASNFDPDVFADPFRFDIRRDRNKRHLALGFGIHTCIGAPVVRQVGRVVLRSLAARFPGLRLDPAAGPIGYGGMAQERAPAAVHVVAS